VVLTACGAVMSTGSNAYGQLGQGDTRKRYALTRLETLRGGRFTTVATGEDHSGAVGENGQLYLWGRGDWGQLGTDDGRAWQILLIPGFTPRGCGSAI
jgi:alpha-tubulin suppressor-like RCC1 family protein